MGGIMDMMKDMYDDGDANTKKMVSYQLKKYSINNVCNIRFQICFLLQIAEAMIKSRSGEKPGMPGMPSGMDNMDI